LQPWSSDCPLETGVSSGLTPNGREYCGSNDRWGSGLETLEYTKSIFIWDLYDIYMIVSHPTDA